MPLQHLDRYSTDPLTAQYTRGIRDWHLPGDAEHLVELADQPIRPSEIGFDALQKTAQAVGLLHKLANTTKYDVALSRRRCAKAV
jgi:hypothetical protein